MFSDVSTQSKKDEQTFDFSDSSDWSYNRAIICLQQILADISTNEHFFMPVRLGYFNPSGRRNFLDAISKVC